MTKNFTREEFACRCGCQFDTVDYELLVLLQEVRDHFDTPVTITSGCRCPSYNNIVGGAYKSQHMFGKAADIQVTGREPSEVVKFINNKYPTTLGLKPYDSWVHVDVRSGYWRG